MRQLHSVVGIRLATVGTTVVGCAYLHFLQRLENTMLRWYSGNGGLAAGKNGAFVARLQSRHAALFKDRLLTAFGYSSRKKIMRLNFAETLVCPTHKSDLEILVSDQEGDDIVSGELTCSTHGCRFPVLKSIPRFVDSDSYADTFSKQRLYVRRHFKDYREDRSGDLRLEPSTGFTEQDLRQGVTLEVGCGYGRFLDTINRRGGRAVGVDLSTHSIELAGDFVGGREGIELVQADLYQLPFRHGSFDRVFSWGVLHHTPDTRKALQAIVPYAKEGGAVSIWVYPPEMKKMDDVYRIVTTRLPEGVLYRLCFVNQVMFSWVRALPGGWRFSKIVPGAIPKNGQTFWQRVLSDFDSLSPKYAFSHSAEEVRGWFVAEGLRDVRILARPTSVTGKVKK